MIKPPLIVSRVVRNTGDARRLCELLKKEFPLCDVDEADVPSVMKDFSLNLDENGRAP